MAARAGSTAGRGMSWRHQVFLARRAAAAARHLRSLPITVLEDAFPGVEELTIPMRHRFQPRGLPHGDAYVLALITAHVRPRRIFEIGTGTGEGTVLMAAQAPEASIDTLDLGDAPASLGEQGGDAPLAHVEVGRAYRESPYAERITQHLGDSARFDYAPFRGEMDMVFVDGAHTYDYVRSDSRTALSLARPGGVVVWDDCHLYHPGVAQALVELSREGIAVARVNASRLAVARAPGAGGGALSPPSA